MTMDTDSAARIFYNITAPIYDFFFGARTPVAIGMRKRLVGKLRLKEGDSILEVSIGTGGNLPYLYEKVGKKGRIYGLDISEGMLAKCRRNAKKDGIPVKLELGRAEALPYEDDSFDAVLHLGGINFFSDKRAAIDEMVRVAKPGAKIVIADEYFPFFKTFEPPLGMLSKNAVGRKLSFESAILRFWILEFRKGQAMNLKRILQKYGKKYSDILGIKLKTKKESEVFKWFIASILLGARISETLALRTYKQFEREGLLSFKRMEKCTWEELVGVLDAGGYVRYDFSTASNLMAIMKLLGEEYKGKLNNLHARAENPADLEAWLQEFRGIGPVTTNIFLRELRGIWIKSEPHLGHLAKKAAKEFGIKEPEPFWRRNKVRGYDFVNFETALMHLGRAARRKKCSVKRLLGLSSSNSI